MTKPEGPTPPMLERIRLPLRIASVVTGYLIYLVVPGGLMARILLWAGFVILDWAIIDVVTKRRKDRVDTLLMGQGLLGTGLLAAGIILILQ